MKKENIYILSSIIVIVLLGILYITERKNAVTIRPRELVTAVPDNTAAIEATAEPPTRIKVHIIGAVKTPGVYETDSGSRVEDVIRLAGGETEDADSNRVNKAAFVSDAQQIVIPAIGEPVDKSFENTQNDMAETTQAASGKININTADENTLTELPGIGPATAANIISYREEHGRFQTIDALKKVTRIGDKTFDRIKDLITAD